MENKKINRPSELLFLLEGRSIFEFAAYFATIPFLMNLPSFPKGDGHPVLVLPGFIASDISTTVLRNFLNQLGYDATPWKLGRNWAHFEELEKLMEERVKYLYKKHNQKVSLVGWSLGGVYAREIAKNMPELIRQVITLGSPFGGIGEASNVGWVYEWISGKNIDDIDPELKNKVKLPPPVPCTAIYTKTDGIVSWEHCVEQEESAITENIEVIGSHCGLGHNPFVLMHIAERLAQPEGQWKPYKEKYGLKCS